MSLYGKYRPQNFTNLIGQDHIRQTLLHEIQKGTLSHAYLFTGPRGTGKTSTARLIAKSLNCLKRAADGQPCDECDFCVTIRNSELIDVIEIDAASNRGIDEIRDLKEKIQFAPTRAKTKTYIIDEVHMLTKEAFNALLKTLEEPPDNVYFILCTTEIHKIPETIISRCQRFDFKRIDVKTLMTRLNYIAQMEGVEAEDEAIELIAHHVEGGMRDAIGLLEQMTINNKLLADHVRSHLGISGHQTINTLIELLEKKEMAKAIHIVNEVHNEGYDLTSFVREILECLRNNLISGIQQGKTETEPILEMMARFEEARDMLRSTVIPQLPIEIAVIKICGGGKIQVAEPVKAKAEVKSKAKEEPQPEVLKKMDEPVADEAQKEEVKTVETIKKEMDMPVYDGDVQKHWPRVLEHIQPPSLRRSIAESKVSETAEGDIKLVFGARFHMEKLNLIENKAKVEKAIEHVFGKSQKVVYELDTVAIPKILKAEPDQLSVPTKKTLEKAEKKSEDIFDTATKMFEED
jgi:DNA polymerase-3 subunit gamma/tau